MKNRNSTTIRSIALWLLPLLPFAPFALGADRPNIVWLVSEDNSAEWLQLYDSGGVSMPNVEKLAEQGLIFNNAFSCAPVCSVARSTLISGCYAPKTGTQYHRRLFAVPMPDGLKMFPYYLREAGYYTTNCSKEDYNFDPADKAGVWDASAKNASYKRRKPGQPFFHVQNFGITHEAKLHFNASDLKKVVTEASTVEVSPYHPDTEIFRHTYAHYMDRHHDLDEQLGAFIQQLEKEDLLKDTFVFYYGDHGGALPRGKGYSYNNGLHVPLVVYVPENWQHLVPAGQGSRIDGFVQFVDFSATVLNLAGVEIPTAIDGKPFLGEGVLLDELNSRDMAYGYADRFDEKYDLVRTIRKGDFKYNRNYQPFNYDGLYNAYRYHQLAYKEWLQLYHEGGLNETQRRFFEDRPAEALYDLSNDPYEVNNLATDPAYASQLQSMRQMLRDHEKSLPDLSFYPEHVWIREGGGNPVEFGKVNREKIADYIDIADLSLLSFTDAKKSITEALNAADPWRRYWGLIVCSTFGNEAAAFFGKASELARSDPENLVRTRAAEFLGLCKADDPRPYILAALKRSNDPIEAALIFNTIVLLQDGRAGYKFEFGNLFKEKGWKAGNTPVGLRLEHVLQK